MFLSMNILPAYCQYFLLRSLQFLVYKINLTHKFSMQVFGNLGLILDERLDFNKPIMK